MSYGGYSNYWEYTPFPFYLDESEGQEEESTNAPLLFDFFAEGEFPFQQRRGDINKDYAACDYDWTRYFNIYLYVYWILYK